MATTAGTLTVNHIINIVIDLLAAGSHVPSSQLRAELEAAGQELPVNSLRVVEVLTKVEAACGVRAPGDQSCGHIYPIGADFRPGRSQGTRHEGEPGDGE